MTLYVNFGPVKARPELLLTGNLPEEAWGKAPRVTMGKAKWDKIRKEVYIRAGGRCEACGEIPNQPLHAHEVYKDGKWTEIVAVCEDCHDFIHLGRYGSLAKEGKITVEEFQRVFKRGRAILEKGGL